MASKSKKSAPAIVRVTILGHSATSVLKWMGSHKWSTEKARRVVTKLQKGGIVADTTISTALSDGRNLKDRHAAPAKLSRDEAKKLASAAK